MEKIILFDTTMRDGRQCPGAGISDQEYFEYIKQADRVGFDQIEAGFPASSQHEWHQVNQIAHMAASGEINATIAGLCQLKRSQVENTIRALEVAASSKKALLHVYFPVDPKLTAASVGEIKREEVLIQLYQYVKDSVDAGMQVQFSPEGYSRVGENFDFCTDLIRAAVTGGATYINCPDTIGGASHWEGANYYVEDMKKHKAIIDKEFPGNRVIWSVHNHNDLGNATENSIWGVVNGVARKVEGTVGGVGERAGNADLLQVLMHLRTYHNKQFDTSHIDFSQFSTIGQFVSEHMLPIQPHYPVIGANAFRHTSGGHVNALLRNPEAYHPFDPKTVGGEISLSFGPQSGGNHAREIIEKAGYICSKEEGPKIGQYIKDRFADRYKGISDQEVLETYFDYRFPLRIESYEKQGHHFTISGNIFEESSVSFEGKTLLSGLKQYLDARLHIVEMKTRDFENHEEGNGIDAIACAKISIYNQKVSFEGVGRNEDIEMASVQALLDAYRKYVASQYQQAS